MDFRLDVDQEAPPAICRVIYRSQMSIEGEPQKVADEIRRILIWSREWNRRAGISGALVFNLRQFAQVLEGPPEAVKNLFGHITCDQRHKDVRLLECGPIPSREFATWSIAFADGSVQTQDPSADGTPQGTMTEAQGIMSLLRFLLNGERAP